MVLEALSEDQRLEDELCGILPLHRLSNSWHDCYVQMKRITTYTHYSNALDQGTPGNTDYSYNASSHTETRPDR